MDVCCSHALPMDGVSPSQPWLHGASALSCGLPLVYPEGALCTSWPSGKCCAIGCYRVLRQHTVQFSFLSVMRKLPFVFVTLGATEDQKVAAP